MPAKSVEPVRPAPAAEAPVPVDATAAGDDTASAESAMAESAMPEFVAKPAIVPEAPARTEPKSNPATPAAASQADPAIAEPSAAQAAAPAKPVLKPEAAAAGNDKGIVSKQKPGQANAGGPQSKTAGQADAAGPDKAVAAPATATEAARKNAEPDGKAILRVVPLPAARPAIARAPAAPVPVTVPPLQPVLDKPSMAGDRRPVRWRISITRISFLLAVILPVILLSLYYIFMASDQYRSEMRFAVRGTERSTLENLGLIALPGASTQAADAYIVIDYIHSKQVLLDMQQKLGIDVRRFFSRPDIDPLYRLDPDMPLEKFIYYWRWMIDASYNSTTSITTFEVTAFDGKDAAAIARAVLKVSDELVNELSTKARLQLISNAQSEVTRTEDRLVVARQAVAVFRDREQTANPTMIAESDQAILQSIETTLIELKSRRASLLSTVDLTSPSVRVLDRQIASYAAELQQKRRGIGSGGQGNGDDRTLTTQLTEYNALSLEQEFAEKAYTSALASLETSQAEARKQERYFAIAVEPDIPEIALYPLRVINVIIAFFVLCVVWLIGYLVVQAVRDHTV